MFIFIKSIYSIYTLFCKAWEIKLCNVLVKHTLILEFENGAEKDMKAIIRWMLLRWSRRSISVRLTVSLISETGDVIIDGYTSLMQFSTIISKCYCLHHSWNLIIQWRFCNLEATWGGIGISTNDIRISVLDSIISSTANGLDFELGQLSHCVYIWERLSD